MNWQATPLRSKHFENFVLPRVQTLLISNFEVKLLQQCTHHGSHLRQGNVLAGASHGTLRERNVHVTVGDDLFGGRDQRNQLLQSILEGFGVGNSEKIEILHPLRKRQASIIFELWLECKLKRE